MKYTGLCTCPRNTRYSMVSSYILLVQSIRDYVPTPETTGIQWYPQTACSFKANHATENLSSAGHRFGGQGNPMLLRQYSQRKEISDSMSIVTRAAKRALRQCAHVIYSKWLHRSQGTTARTWTPVTRRCSFHRFCSTPASLCRRIPTSSRFRYKSRHLEPLAAVASSSSDL
jgi:hypothetical protein